LFTALGHLEPHELLVLSNREEDVLLLHNKYLSDAVLVDANLAIFQLKLHIFGVAPVRVLLVSGRSTVSRLKHVQRAFGIAGKQLDL
jgi:hypothetical protein